MDDWTWGEPMPEPREREPRVRIGPYVYQSPPGAENHRWAGPPPQPDSWDFDPDADVPNVRYHGVRRADGDRPRRRLHLVLAVVGGLAVLAVAIPLIGWLTPADVPTTSTPVSPEAAPPSDTEATASAVPTSAPAVTVAARPPVTAPVVAVEAEAGPPDVKRRDAIVVKLAGASGGQVVRLTGNSEIEWRGVDIPSAGTYRITVYYVGGDAGTAQVSAANAAPSTITFVAGAGCCLTAAFDVALPAGRQSIVLSVTSGAPSIDRLTITAP
jgi:hypothetical protein